ncbi:MAG TPA: hypothetical protein VF268_07980 [Gammaproteobacteria bacterium]
MTDSVTQIVSAVADGNLKVISERLNMLFAKINVHLAHQDNSEFSGPGLQARSAVDILTDNELAETIVHLKAVLEAITAGSARVQAGR